MAGGIHPPLSIIESWPTPNFIDPITRGSSLVVLCTVLGTCSIFFVSARLWARSVIQHNNRVDDYFMIAAILPALGLVVGICLASRVYCFDRHIWDVPLNKLEDQRKITLANECFYVLATGLVKLSVVLFYRRLAVGTLTKRITYTVCACTVFVVAYMIIFTCAIFFSCIPFLAFWNQVVSSWPTSNVYHCIDEGATLLAASAISVVQDFIIALLPMLLLWQIQMPIRQRIFLAATLAVGFFLCITGIMRIVYIYRIFYETYDVTWAAYDLWAWTAIELLLGMMCASVPGLKVFLRRYLTISTRTSFVVDGFWCRSTPEGLKQWYGVLEKPKDANNPEGSALYGRTNALYNATYHKWPGTIGVEGKGSSNIERDDMRTVYVNSLQPHLLIAREIGVEREVDFSQCAKPQMPGSRVCLPARPPSVERKLWL